MTSDRLRTVVQEPRFEAELQALESDIRRMDEALRYAEFHLAQTPDGGIPSSVPGIWVAPVRVPSQDSIVRASIFYTFTDDHVHLQSIRLAP